MNPLRIRFLPRLSPIPGAAAFVCLALAAGADANDNIPADAEPGPILVTGATIHPVSGDPIQLLVSYPGSK